MDDVVKTVTAAICTAIGFLWGSKDGLIIALLVFIVLDYITGVICAIVEKKLSSEVGAKGIAKKILMLFIVAVANIIDVTVLKSNHALRGVAVIFYLANESISLLENAGRLGVPFPKKILTVLEQLKTDSDKDGQANKENEE